MKNILIADDSAFQRKNIRRMLSEKEYTIFEASTGQETIAHIAQHQFDCILLDLVMPEGDGYAVLQTLQERDSTVPVIVITADIQDSTRQQCLELGAKQVINKPQTEPQLTVAIDAVLNHEPGCAS